MAHWHGLAKLRMHTDTTLDIMDAVTSDLGEKLRAFQQRTCAFFKTRELRREADARNRRQAKNIQGHARSGQPSLHHMSLICPSRSSQPSGSNITLNPNQAISSKGKSQRTAQQPKTLNLNTYKFHALGDYTSTIRQYGTTDSYSTEAVRAHHFHTRLSLKSTQAELEHRTPKARYTRTSRKQFVKQLAQIERRQTRIRRARDQLARSSKIPREKVANDVEASYNIGKSQNCPVNLAQFVQTNEKDPAVKVPRASPLRM
jgi:hypothetical protein